MSKKKNSIATATTLVFLAMLVLSTFSSASTTAVNSNPIVSMDFTFENKWGTYEASAYFQPNQGPSPTVIVVHGYGAKKDWYMWIVDALTRSGFAVVAFTVPMELDLLAMLRLLIGGMNIEDFFSMIPFEEWPDGIRDCITTITTDQRFSKIIDSERIAVIGHSAGGMAGLVVASQDARIKCVIALAPPVQAEELPHPIIFGIPIQLQIGTRDKISTEEVKKYFDSLKAPKKELIIIEGGNHLQFMDTQIVDLIELMRPLLGDLLNNFDNPATISVEEQHSQSSAAFLPFIKAALASPITFHDYDGLWHTTDFTITLTAKYGVSGVAVTYYKINGGPTQNVTAYGQPLVTVESANNTIEYWSVDDAGNEELPHKILTGIKLDKTPPKGSITINNNATYTTSASVTLALTAADTTSGVYQVRYSDDGVWNTEPWEGFSTTKAWTLTSGDGTKTVYYQIKDKAGLISTYLDAIVLDTTSPTGSITIAGGATYTNSSSVTLTLSADDATSGVAQMRFSHDNVTWTPWEPYATSKVWILITGDGTKTVYVQFKDAAGLISQSCFNAIILDKMPPVATIGLSGVLGNNGWFTSDVTVTLSATDDVSGVDKTEYSFDNATWITYMTPLTMTNEGYALYYKSTDKAGNVEMIKSGTIKIDKTPPTIRITSPSPGYEIGSSTVTITWTGSDEASGISHYEIRLDGGSWAKVGTTRTHTFTGLSERSHTVDIKATDEAGNTKQDTVSFTVNISPERNSKLQLALDLSTNLAYIAIGIAIIAVAAVVIMKSQMRVQEKTKKKDSA